MIVYTYIIMVLQLLALGSGLGKQDGKEILNRILNISMMMPFYGRVLGWW